jgi:predicted NBD/HSP70 family sugar kinase
VNRGKSGSLSSLRELNRVRVLEVVRERGSVSRADIARATGLARSTVSTLVGELVAKGLLVEQEEARGATPSQTGRPPALLSLDPGAGSVLGIRFDHGYVRVAIADLSLTIMAAAERGLDIDHDGAAGLDAAADLIEDVLVRTEVDRERVLGVGVGLPGPIHSRSIGSTVLPGWMGIDVQVELEQRLCMPVHLENDANLGGLAESVLGAGRGASEMLYVMLSSGIGAALILGGRLYRGSGGTAGEIGHVLVDESGPMCRCGNRGCLETLAGSGALVDLLRRSHGEDLTVELMIANAESGDPGCQRVLADAGQTVGATVAALCNQLNPERVVVGGQLASAGELLLEPLRHAVQRHALPAAVEHLQVVGGELGHRAELLGACVLVLGQSERSFTGLVPTVVGG